jgi:hypothetical protein
MTKSNLAVICVGMLVSVTLVKMFAAVASGDGWCIG